MKKKNVVSTILSFASKCKWKMIISVICATISVFGGIVPYVGAYRIIRLFIDQTATTQNVLDWVWIILAGYVIKVAFHTFSTMLSHISAYIILEQIRLTIIRKLMKAPLGTVLNQRVGSMKHIIVDKVEEIEIPLAHVIPELFSHMLLPIAVFVFLLTIDWRMALAALITIPIAGVSMAVMMKNFNTQYKHYMKASDHVNSVIVEYAEGIEVIKAFNQSSSSYEKFAYAIKSFKEYTLDWFSSTWGLMNFTLSVLPSSLLGTVPIGMYLYMNGQLSPSDFSMCIILSLGIVAPLLKFSAFINDAKSIEYSIKDVNKLLEIKELKDSKERIILTDYNVEFKNCSFAYSGLTKDRVLHNINLKIPEGDYYALVGPSGGGKSTIAKLLARFWDVDDGAITIGGTDIRKIPIAQLTKMISFVTQDNFLFDCSIMDNIRLGNRYASDEDVYRAAKAAMCDEFIRKLDNGYHTDAGEAGKRLSGGEKQRIAVARAILKDAPIVILDEATAFTDPENEHKIQKSLAALTKDKTLLVIAHRLSTVKNADRIILMEKGQIHEVDTHEHLLLNNQLYAGMWQAHINSKSWSTASGKKEVEMNV